MLSSSLSSAQLVDRAENTAAWETEDDPFSPSSAKNSVRATVFPFFFLAFLARTSNKVRYNTAIIRDLYKWERSIRENRLKNEIKGKERESVKLPITCFRHLGQRDWKSRILSHAQCSRQVVLARVGWSCSKSSEGMGVRVDLKAKQYNLNWAMFSGGWNRWSEINYIWYKKSINR